MPEAHLQHSRDLFSFDISLHNLQVASFYMVEDRQVYHTSAPEGNHSVVCGKHDRQPHDKRGDRRHAF